MKKKILITSFDMEIGGVERSLASMLSNFNYEYYQVDLHLHSHTGPLMDLIDHRVTLLPEKQSCKTFRKGIKYTLLSGFPALAIKRLIAKLKSEQFAKKCSSNDAGYYQFQQIWNTCYRNVEQINAEYDVAISYLWPHHFTAFNVTAKLKFAWIHTDYSIIDLDIEKDLQVWQKFDYIVSISDACTVAFLKIHPSLENKIIVIENLTNPDYVKMMAKKPLEKVLSNGFNLVSVGRLCNAKAFERAVEVLAELDERGYKNINWYIVGDGGDRVLIENKIKQYKLEERFILLGSTTNPYPYMNASDIYLQPSRYEGKAVTVSEALILAKPVIITNYSTASSQINHEVNGIICNQSISDISDAIIDLYNSKDRQQQLIAFNQQSKHTNIEELQKLYRII